jgi:predicted nuclease of restriction endonuclease-like (RecB) superfamily
MVEGATVARRGGGDLAGDAEYVKLLAEIRQRIAVARTRAAVAVNQELTQLYWGIGREILRRQQEEGWGAKVIGQLAKDLKEEGHRGFSRSNLHYMRAFAGAWEQDAIVQQSVGQIPWGHNLVLLDRLDDSELRLWYAERCMAEGWSRNTLIHQIASQLHRRQGAAVTNFAGTLPAPESEFAQEMIRDPYDLSFLLGEKIAGERDLELALLEDVERFLLALGNGFAFVGRQKRLEVGGNEFFVDLLFFHVELLRYVVIELKVGKFKPEFAGKLNFYLNVVDDKMRRPHHNDTIGILLCTDRSRTVVEYALKGIESPIGVSTFQTDALPLELEERLPSAAELAGGLQRIVEERADEVGALLQNAGGDGRAAI